MSKDSKPFFLINSCNLIIYLCPISVGFLLVAWVTVWIGRSRPQTLLFIPIDTWRHWGISGWQGLCNEPLLWRYSTLPRCQDQLSRSYVTALWHAQHLCQPVSLAHVKVLGMAYEGCKSQGAHSRLDRPLQYSIVTLGASAGPIRGKNFPKLCHLNCDLKAEWNTTRWKESTGRMSPAKTALCTKAQRWMRQQDAFDKR